MSAPRPSVVRGLAACALVALAGCDAAGPPADGGVVLRPPPGWGPVPVPPTNPLTPEKVALGRRLFSDPILSGDGTVSCATCHRADLAFTDGLARSVGTAGRVGLRGAPSLLGVAYERLLHRDGGVFTLEAQTLAPIEEPTEMDARLGDVLARLAADPSYAEAFRDAFGGEGPGVRTRTQALASFERTLLPSGAPVDRFNAGDVAALSPEARAGRDLFEGRAGCAACHGGVRQTEGAFRHNGLTPTAEDPGRARVTGNPADVGVFKTPSLRNVARTAPYMHDGRLATLDAVVDHYDRGGDGAPGQDPAVRPLHLTAAERDALVAFLHALTDSAP